MIRYAALILIAALCAGVGFSMAQKLKSRLLLLEAFAHSLSRLQSEIAYAATPLIQAVQGLGAIEPFWSAFADALLKGESTPQSWLRAEKAIPIALLGEKVPLELRKFAQRLGKSTRAEEMQNFARVQELLKIEIESARSELQKKGKMYKGIGVLSGLALVIVLI